MFIEDNKKIVITLIPGLGKSLLEEKKVKDYYFYSYLKSVSYSGTVKNYNLSEFCKDLNLSKRTIQRRLSSLENMGWIKKTKKDIHIRSLRKVAHFLKVYYNEKNPKKTRHTLESKGNYRLCLNIIRYKVLKANLDGQKFKFQRNLKSLSKSYFSCVKKHKMSITQIKLLLLKEGMKHSSILSSLDFTLSRHQIAEIWNCSPIEASRGIKQLVKQGLVSDKQRIGFLKKGSYNEAMALRKDIEDETIFFKKGAIYKRLKNEVEILDNPNEEGYRGKTYLSKFGDKEYHPRILKKLDQRFNKAIALISTNLELHYV